MSKIQATAAEKKYTKWIWILSITIPLVVAILFKVKLDIELPVFLPPIYAAINGCTAIILLLALWAVKNKKLKLHENLMKTAIGLSILFLLMYILYHMTSDSTSYEGAYRGVYLFILLTHIVLSVAVIPFVLITYVRALAKSFERHKKIARITFPLWLYVAISGVIVYLMISPYYV